MSDGKGVKLEELGVDFEDARSFNGNPGILKGKKKKREKSREVRGYLEFRSINSEGSWDKFPGFFVDSILQGVEFQ
jgi:hypothetical protein